MTVEYCTSSLLKRLSRKLSLAFNSPKQLAHEQHHAFIAGADDDLASLWCLDQEIGDITKPFDKVGFISDEAQGQINKYIKALSPVFKRVSAYQIDELEPLEDAAATVHALLTGKKETPEDRRVPVRYLDYYNRFISLSGSQINHKVASIRLG